MRKGKDRRKTRQFMGEEDYWCPKHNKLVVSRMRWNTDKKTGKPKRGGEYLGCPTYKECGYHLSWCPRRNQWRVPILED